jgi:hypothetical protein
MGLGLGGQFGTGPAIAIAGTIGGIARLYERTGVRSALKAVAQAKAPAAEKSALQMLNKEIQGVIKEVAPNAAAQGAANSTSRPEYEALWGRY